MSNPRVISTPWWFRVGPYAYSDKQGQVSNPPPTNVATDLKSGFVNSDWKVRAAKHEDAGSNYTLRKHKYDAPVHVMESMYGEKWGPAWTERYTTYLTPADFWVPPSSIAQGYDSTVADDIALKRLKGKLARDLDQFKALVPLAELDETRSLIRTTADATGELLKALVEIKHGKYQVLQKAGKAWLQFSFAIAPTISDVNAAVNSIGSYLLKESNNLVYRGSYETAFNAIDNPNVDYPTYQGHYINNYRRRFAYNYRVSYTAGVKADIRSANNYGVSDHFGLSFGELPSVGWELIPFSWVADYFGTIGAFLEDTFSSDAGNTVYVTKSSKLTISAQGEFYARLISEGSPWRLISYSGSPHSVDCTIFERTSLSALPHRALRLKTLDEVGTNGVNRLLNLASILVAK